MHLLSFSLLTCIGSNIWIIICHCHSKGQLILKAIYGLLTSPKKRTDEFVLFAFLLFTANKSNLSVRFLGESTAANLLFDFIWPLVHIFYVFFLHVNRRSRFFSFRSPIRFYCLAMSQAKHCWLWSKSIVSHCLSHFLWCSNVNMAATEGTWGGQNCVSLNNWKPQRQHRKSLW